MVMRSRIPLCPGLLQCWQPDVSGAVAWLAVVVCYVAAEPATLLGDVVMIVIARCMPAKEAVRVQVAYGLLDGHGDDSPTGQTGGSGGILLGYLSHVLAGPRWGDLSHVGAGATAASLCWSASSSGSTQRDSWRADAQRM